MNCKTIAVCGIDGAGKSFIVSKIKFLLEQEGKAVLIYYPFNYIILNKFLSFLKKSEKNKKKNKFLKKNKKFIFKFWPFFVIFDNFFQNLKINFLKRKNDYIIFDRYYYDLATSFQEYNYTFNWLYKLYISSIKKPSICFFMLSEPEAAMSKETNDLHSLCFFKRQVLRYQKISKIKNIPVFYNNYSENSTREVLSFVKNEIKKYNISKKVL